MVQCTPAHVALLLGARIAYRKLVNVELRRYLLKPGRREDLIELFEREFVQSQEACGITLLGRYRNLDDPQAFVWLRGFQTMEQRKDALEAFYERSDAWATHRNAANDTMIDSDNVLLLRPARAASGFGLDAMRAPFAAVRIVMLEQPANEQYIDEFERSMLPQLSAIAGNVAYFVTEPARNTYPRLPVREGQWAFVVVGECAAREALDAWHEISHASESLRLETIETSCLR